MANFVVLGSDPPGPFPKFLNSMLMDAVAAKWDTYCPDPPAANPEYDNGGVTFWEVRPPQQNDIEIWFEMITDIPDPASRPLGWSRIPRLCSIMIHVYCKSDSVEHYPAYMPAVIHGLEDILFVEGRQKPDGNNNLIPNTHYLTMVRSMEVPKYNEHDQLFAVSCQVNIRYTMLVV